MNTNFTISNTNVKFMEGTEGLNSYLTVLRKYDSLTAEEERDLFERYQKNGDMKARELIYLHNQRFIYSNAKIYARDSEEVMDYVNEGNIALSEAIDKFDLSLGNKFITFAVWYIRRAMNYYLINTRDCITKTNGMKLFKKTDKIAQKFYSENGREPTLEEIRDILEKEYKIKINDLSDLYDLNLSSISSEIDSEFTVEDTGEFTQKTATYNLYDDESEREYSKELASKMLSKLLKVLANDKTSLDIIKKGYGIGYDKPYSMVELAEEYGMSCEDMEAQINKIIMYVRQENNVALETA